MSTPISAVVITVSDACARGERHDESGDKLVELLTEIGAQIVSREVVSDDLLPLVELLKKHSEKDDVNLIVTTGGTGFGPRDNTPEATKRIIEREAPVISVKRKMKRTQKKMSPEFVGAQFDVKMLRVE